MEPPSVFSYCMDALRFHRGQGQYLVPPGSHLWAHERLPDAHEAMNAVMPAGLQLQPDRVVPEPLSRNPLRDSRIGDAQLTVPAALVTREAKATG